MTFAACFVLDVTCQSRTHNPDLSRHDQFTGDNRREAFAKAKKDGWKLDMENWTAICPDCAAIASKKGGEA